MQSLSEDHRYRNYGFKTMLTMIIGRPTKYLLMMDQIHKNETVAEHQEPARRACEAARSFAAKIDQGLSIGIMTRLWDEMAKTLDASSVTTVAGENKQTEKRFTMADLRTDHPKTNPRRICCLGPVQVKRPGQKEDKGDAFAHCVLFDDIIVLLQRRSNKTSFFEPVSLLSPCKSFRRTR